MDENGINEYRHQYRQGYAEGLHTGETDGWSKGFHEGLEKGYKWGILKGIQIARSEIRDLDRTLDSVDETDAQRIYDEIFLKKSVPTIEEPEKQREVIVA